MRRPWPRRLESPENRFGYYTHFDPDGRRFIVFSEMPGRRGARGSNLQDWSVEREQRERLLEFGQARSLAVHPDGRQILVLGALQARRSPGDLVVIDRETHEVIWENDEHYRELRSVRWGMTARRF